jgi:hypothetical protein
VDPPPIAFEPNPDRSSKWYGWQTLAADGVSAGLLSIGLVSWTVESTVGGYAGLLLATPVIHVVHGHVGRGIGSFALRLLIPAFGAGVGLGASYLAERDELTELSGVRSAGVGAGIGAAICVALDAAVFAYEPKRDVRSQGHLETRPQMMLHINRTIGVTGTF